MPKRKPLNERFTEKEEVETETKPSASEAESGGLTPEQKVFAKTGKVVPISKKKAKQKNKADSKDERKDNDGDAGEHKDTGKEEGKQSGSEERKKQDPDEQEGAGRKDSQQKNSPKNGTKKENGDPEPKETVPLYPVRPADSVREQFQVRVPPSHHRRLGHAAYVNAKIKKVEPGNQWKIMDEAVCDWLNERGYTEVEVFGEEQAVSPKELRISEPAPALKLPWPEGTERKGANHSIRLNVIKRVHHAMHAQKNVLAVEPNTEQDIATEALDEWFERNGFSEEHVFEPVEVTEAPPQVGNA